MKDIKENKKRIHFVIPNNTPPSLNKIKGQPFGYVSRIKKEWSNILYVYSYNAGWRPAEKKGHYRNARIVLRFPDKKRRDLDNFQKILLDALFYAGLIWDDSVQKLNFTLTILPNTGKRETEITLW